MRRGLLGKTAALLLALLISGAPAAADDLIRSQARAAQLFQGGGATVPALQGGIVPAKYRYVPNPDYKDPEDSPPPNLRQGHLDRVFQAMDRVAASLPGRLEQKHKDRLRRRLEQMDRYFIEPIPSEKWYELAEKMARTARSTAPDASGDWDVVVDEMLKTAASGLNDRYTDFMDPGEYKEYKDDSADRSQGVGVWMKEHDRGAEVDFPFPGSPAAKAGIREGDVLVSVDGVSMAGKDFSEVVQRVRGKPGTEVRLGVSRGGRMLPPVTVMRSSYERNNVVSKMLPGSDIGYVHFGEFNTDTDKQVIQAVKELRWQGAAKLVLDVRGNPGGWVSTVSEIASEFLKDGQPIVSFRTQGQERSRNVTDGDGLFSDMPVAVLVDGDSASASEILAGALQDQLRQPAIIGSRTFGKGVAQTVIAEEHEKVERALKITASKWLTPDGRNVQHGTDPATGRRTGGVVPDIEVPVSADQEEALADARFREMNGASPRGEPPKDPALDAAVRLFSLAGSS